MAIVRTVFLTRGKDTFVLDESRRPLRGVFDGGNYPRPVSDSNSDYDPSRMFMTG
jgi:hypothetical protein